ncbi:MAG: hypothetical protein II931_06730 [Clostridia bacterium]|nr:hypothetical protein [Clostridia bacterium]
MLTPQQLEKVADTIVPIWDELKEWITLDLIDRIISRLDSGEDISFSSSEMWRIEVFEELGGLTEDLQEQIVKTTRASENEVRRIFLEYGEQAVRADNAVFDGNNLASTEENTSYKPENSSVQAENRRDVNDVSTAAEIPSESRTGDETAAENKPLDNISDRMKDIMNDAYERTNGELRNFTRTTADSVQTEFIKELDRAYLKVVSNACSQWQAAQEAVDNIIKHQGYVTYPSGHVDTIEVAVIRAIRTGVARMSAALVVEGAKKHGMNHVLVSSHLGARVGDGTESPCNHAWWQGKVYSIEGGDEKYPNLEKVTGYPSDPRGLCGYNCRHNLTAFDPETMKNHFEKFDDEENKKAYEFSQKLRYYERNIRKAKTEIMAFSKAVENCKDENLAEHFQTELDKAKARLDRLNEEYKKLCEDSDLRVAYERLYVARTPRNIEDIRNKTIANSGESGIIKEKEMNSELGKFKQKVINDERMSKEYYSDVKEKFSHGSDVAKEAFNKFVPTDSVVNSEFEGTPHFDPNTKQISMNYSADLTNERGTCVTWFHEHGHMVDNLGGTLSDNEEFNKLLHSDYMDYMKAYGKNNGLNTFDKVQGAISNDLNDMRKHSAVADILEGVSECNIQGIAGHGRAYWQNPKNLTSEAFAHMFEAQFDNVRYAEMQKYFPNSLAKFEEILKEAVKK